MQPRFKRREATNYTNAEDLFKKATLTKLVNKFSPCLWSQASLLSLQKKKSLHYRKLDKFAIHNYTAR
jgi:hypothetical protein